MKDFFRCCDGDEAAEQEAEEIDKQEREERDDANAIATSDAKHCNWSCSWPIVSFSPFVDIPPSIHEKTFIHAWLSIYIPFFLFGDVFHPLLVPTYLIAFA